MIRFIISSITISITISFTIADARILRVPDEYRSIQSAVNAAGAADTVLVAPGRYIENIDLGIQPITLTSEIIYGWNPEIISSTIIDGDQNAPVVMVNVDGRCHIRGFTIENGLSDRGGGINVNVCNLGIILEDLIVSDNEANSGNGGGIYVGYHINAQLKNVSVINNRSSGNGGGGFFSGELLELENCRFVGNTATSLGGGFYLYGLVLNMTECLIARNSGTYSAYLRGTTLHVNRITVADNSGDPYGGMYYITSRDNSIVNSIIYGNIGAQIRFGGQNPFVFNVDYSLIQSGRDGLAAHQNMVVNLTEVLNRNPLFVNRQIGNYALTGDSPCIDAGDPNSPPDPDGSRADMGALPFKPSGAWINGRVTDAHTGDSIPGLIIRTAHGIELTTDVLGRWYYFRPGYFEESRVVLNISHRGFVTHVLDTNVVPFDSLWFEVRLNPALFHVSPETIIAEVDSGRSLQVPLTIFNETGGPLMWSALSKPAGNPGFALGGQRDSFQATEITGDDHIESVAFDGEHYYLAGANGADTNLVYILDKSGESIGDFPQVGSLRYGYKDMEWDGEHLWAAGGDSIYAFDTAGRVVTSWHDPLNTSQYIAIDNNEGTIWLCGTATDIMAFDRRGNSMGCTISRNNFRFYGLGWCADDPDGFNLYCLTRSGLDPHTRVYKIKPATGDTSLVFELPYSEGSNGFQSVQISRRFDRYQGSVLVTIDDREVNRGGDQLEVFQLYRNSEWITFEPDSGIIAPDGEFEIQVNLRTIGDDREWALLPDPYWGEVILEFDVLDGRVNVPVRLNVIDPNTVSDPQLSAFRFQLFPAFPNPFNSSLTISFTTGIPPSIEGGQKGLSLRIYDLSGRLVADLTPAAAPPRAVATHSVTWNAEGLPGGIYLVRLESGSESRTMKAILMK